METLSFHRDLDGFEPMAELSSLVFIPYPTQLWDPLPTCRRAKELGWGHAYFYHTHLPQAILLSAASAI